MRRARDGAHARSHVASRAGRLRPVGVERSPLPAGAPAAVDHRPVGRRGAADDQPRRHRGADLQRRNLQPRGASPRTAGARQVRVEDGPLRHRSAAACLRGMGTRFRPAALRDVRPGHLRHARSGPARAAPDPRPRRHQADVFRAHRTGANGCSRRRFARSSRTRTSRRRWIGPPSGTTSPSSSRRRR